MESAKYPAITVFLSLKEFAVDEKTKINPQALYKDQWIGPCELKRDQPYSEWATLTEAEKSQRAIVTFMKMPAIMSLDLLETKDNSPNLAQVLPS